MHWGPTCARFGKYARKWGRPWAQLIKRDWSGKTHHCQVLWVIDEGRVRGAYNRGNPQRRNILAESWRVSRRESDHEEVKMKGKTQILRNTRNPLVPKSQTWGLVWKGFQVIWGGIFGAGGPWRLLPSLGLTLAGGGDAAEGCVQRMLRVLKNSAVTGSLG